MAFPQIQAGQLVIGGNVVARTNGAVTLTNGEWTQATTGASDLTATLPAVALGGVVMITKLDAGGGGKITVACPSGEGSKLDGTALSSAQTVCVASAFHTTVLVSDGSNWYTLIK